MLIEVTQEDIENGVPGSAEFCPIGLAVCRAGAKRRAITTNTIALGNKVYSLGPRARYFVWRFDTGQPVEPFSFEIALDVAKPAC